MDKGFIKFPLKLDISKSKEIDEAVYQLNLDSLSKVSKHQFILNAVNEKLQNRKEKSNVQ